MTMEQWEEHCFGSGKFCLMALVLPSAGSVTLSFNFPISSSHIGNQGIGHTAGLTLLLLNYNQIVNLKLPQNTALYFSPENPKNQT